MFDINWHHLEKEQTREEELVNSRLHAVAVGMSLVGFLYLIFLGLTRQNAVHFLAFFLYGLSVLFMYCASTLYHGSHHVRVKRVFEKLDYIAIFFLIAGTYTPFVLIMLRNYMFLGWGTFFAVWALAIVGSVYTILRVKHVSIVNVIIYAAMGLFSVLFIPLAYNIKGLPIIVSTLVGGLVILAGVYFFGVAKFRYAHAVWHVLVLIGTAIHFFTIITFL